MNIPNPHRTARGHNKPFLSILAQKGSESAVRLMLIERVEPWEIIGLLVKIQMEGEIRMGEAIRSTLGLRNLNANVAVLFVHCLESAIPVELSREWWEREVGAREALEAEERERERIRQVGVVVWVGFSSIGRSSAGVMMYVGEYS